MKKFFSFILIILFGYLTSYMFVGKSKGYEIIPKNFNIEEIVEDLEKYIEDLSKTKVSEQDSLNAVENFDEAMKYYHQGNYERASLNFEYAFEINPYYYEAEYYLAKSYLKNEQYYDAYFEFDQLLNNSSDYDSSHLYLAQVNFYIDDYSAAANSIEQFLNIYPDSEEGLYWRANISYYNGYQDLAISYLQDLIKVNSNYAPAYSLLSKFYVEQQEPKKSILMLRTAYNILPDNTEIAFNLASIYYQKNNLDSALFFVETLINYKSTDDRAYNLLALIYLQEGKFDEAHAAISKALEYNYLYAYVATRAEIFSNQGDYKSANFDYLECYKSTSENKYLILIAETYEKIGDYKEAIEYYSSYLDNVSYDDTNRNYVVERIQAIEDGE